ncbi:MAG: YceI family protein [Bacteroidia bacterium]
MTKTKWAIDPAHSEIGFKIKHLMISNVNGSFKKYSGTVETEQEDDFKNASIQFEADVNSIDTANEQRDGHLRTGDFFESEKYPKLKFTSSKTEPVGDGKYYVHGDMTIKDVTKPITFEAEFSGIAKDPYGQTKAGFEIRGKINRKDFGLTWNAPLETGGMLLSDEVKIHGEVQLIKQA